MIHFSVSYTDISYVLYWNFAVINKHDNVSAPSYASRQRAMGIELQKFIHFNSSGPLDDSAKKMSTLEQAKQDYFVLSSSIFKSIIKLLKSSLVLDVGKATLTAVGKLKSFFGSIFGKTVNSDFGTSIWCG